MGCTYTVHRAPNSFTEICVYTSTYYVYTITRRTFHVYTVYTNKRVANTFYVVFVSDSTKALFRAIARRCQLYFYLIDVLTKKRCAFAINSIFFFIYALTNRIVTVPNNNSKILLSVFFFWFSKGNWGSFSRQ